MQRRICGASIIPYPPGIPLVCPGEVLDEEDIQYVLRLRERGENVIGIDEQNRITVISEPPLIPMVTTFSGISFPLAAIACFHSVFQPAAARNFPCGSA